MNLTTFITYTRDYLGDNNSNSALWTWTAAQLLAWIQNAIADYSIHFPRRMSTSIDATAGARLYNLPYNVHGIIDVEYLPLGTSETPRRFLTRMDWHLDEFFSTTDVYDWFTRVESDAGTQPSTIIVNPATAADADTYTVNYFGDHVRPAIGADIISVPDRHLNIVLLYIRWQAILELSTGVKRASYIAPGGMGGGTVAQPYSEIDLKRTMESYQSAIALAKKAESESATLHWDMDKYGRVY
jgi:hypothetical protein